MKLYVGWILSVVLLLLATSSALARKWIDSTGKHSVEAELVEINNGKVVLRKATGSVVTVPVARLSEADRQYLQSLPESSSEAPNTVYQTTSLLHQFTGGRNDGRGPKGGLTLSKSTIFGTTMGGGEKDMGTIFSLTPEPDGR